jgi:hypothetical protein
MLDDKTHFHAIPDYLGKPRKDVDKATKCSSALKAVHMNVYVSEVIITVLGVWKHNKNK